VIISKQHPGSAYPKYFLCTDLSLSPQEDLGLGDFRLQSFEAIQKWFQIVFLALNYLQHQQTLVVVKPGKLRILANNIRIHRQEHASNLLHAVAERILTAQFECLLCGSAHSGGLTET
jgi:hypothetical protein